MVAGCEMDDTWSDGYPNAAPVLQVQQEAIQSFDLIFDIGGTWFPDDSYLKIDYNVLHWDTFTLNMAQLPALDGIHPRCRVIGMNGFILPRPVRDDMPTQKQLENWFSWFSCNSAYGYPEPEGYDYDEMGKQAAQNSVSNEELEARRAEGEKLRDDLEMKYMYGDGCNDDPETWDLVPLNRVSELMAGREHRRRWVFPEKPSWIEHGTLEEPHVFP